MLLALIEKHGTHFFPNNTTPFSLDDSGNIWWVVSGALDFFAIENQSSPRIPICRAKAGQAVFGLKNSKKDQINFIAVGTPDTEVICLTREQLSHLLSAKEMITDFSEWIKDWIKNFSIYHWMSPYRKTFIPTDCLSVENLLIALDKFNESLVEELIKKISQKNKKDMKRLHKKNVVEKEFFNDSLYNLASIVSVEKKHFTITKTNDVLFDACQYVAKSLGVTFNYAGHDKKIALSQQQHLENIVKSANLLLRPVSLLLTAEWWKKDCGALLAFKKDTHQPVALIPVSTHRYTMIDVFEKTQVTVNQQVANMLSDDAYMFFRALPDKPISLADLIRFSVVGNFYDGMRLLTMGILGGIASVAVPFATGILFDDIIPGNEKSQLISITLLLMVIAFGMGIFELIRSIALLRIEGRVNTNTQAAIIARLFSLPAPFFRRFTSGDLAQRAFATDNIIELLTGAIQTAVLSGVFSIFSGIYMYFLSVSLALLATVLVGIAVIIFIGLNYWRLTYERQYSRLQGAVLNRIFQLLNGIAKLRIASAEAKSFSLWTKDFGAKISANVKAQKISNYLLVFNAVFLVSASLVIFGYVGLTGLSISIGKFLAFNAAFVQFSLGILGMSVALTSSLKAIPLYERAKPILQALPEVDKTKLSPGLLRGDIDISHVAFRYQKEAPLILKDINMKINAGDFVAIVGPSSSGKTTIFRLLLGLEQSEMGAIYYDEKNLTELDIQAVRRQMGVVIQNAKLMPGDILMNIIGSSAATLEDAWEAARLSGFDQDIKMLPMGMQTIIGEGVGTISGGQRQRILIARAIVNKPKIILFDEASSALDNVTQAVVSQSLKELKATRIVIAHRLSTIIQADKIFVVDEGCIVESGNYAELMQLNKRFAELAKRQLVE